MSDLNSPEDALAKLRTLVREGNFEFAPRKKSHVTSKLARIIVDTLSIDTITLWVLTMMVRVI